MGVSAAAVGLASAAAAISGEPAVVTVSAAAILAMFAERNLRYPRDRERLGLALKSRKGFEAFIVSGAGMLDFDGAQRGQLPAGGDGEQVGENRRDLGGGDEIIPVLALNSNSDALEKLRSEIAAQYDESEVGGEVQATVEKSMKSLGLSMGSDLGSMGSPEGSMRSPEGSMRSAEHVSMDVSSRNQAQDAVASAMHQRLKRERADIASAAQAGFRNFNIFSPSDGDVPSELITSSPPPSPTHKPARGGKKHTKVGPR
mmetsp:Transcript_10025/g.16024  ORF Transcript_10025/g.16024 Transcript_10025/m.16024 type:complete len:258 (-) Transcript_10025:117-890(-)